MLESLLSRARGRAAFWATTLFVLFCLVMVATSTPRRVGDGAEYWAMAEQLAAFHRPSVARGDVWRLEREAHRIDHGFDASSFRFPELVAADGRQDFPHFWLYPLANVPALWLTHALGVHPNWAFTLTNCALLAGAFVIVARYVSVVWAVLILGGPVIWWIDKAHGDVFTVSLLAMGCALWHRAPGVTVVLVALAAAQNPALMPVWLVIASVACVANVASLASLSAVIADRRVTGTLVAAAIGGAILALPLAYYMTRLHVWSPLIGYTHPGLPSIRAVVSLLCDANVGLLANAPLLLGAVLVGLTIERAWMRREWAIVACAWVILLAGYAQSMNLNHGATPGINRWTLWLTPWLLLVVPADTRARAGATNAGVTNGSVTNAGVTNARHASLVVLMLMLTTLHVAWSIWFFRPGLPEVYRYPTRVASWLWTHVPAWSAPAPEIFAERASHREPPVLPIAWDGCTIVLVIDGEWPLSCLPTAPAPAMCRGPGMLCYAVPARASSVSAADERTAFVPLGTASFPAVIASRRWPVDESFLRALRARVATGTQQDPGLRADADAASVVRATDRVSWTHVWKGSSLLLIYLDDVQSGASLHLRAGADHRGVLIDLDTNQKLADITLTQSHEQPAALELPTSVRHGLLWLESEPHRP
jgi:hypothetical protein